jgi:hypothetical protein
LENKKGAWVNIYLKNGLLYQGKLRDHTVDPNSSRKEISLTNFLLAKQKNDSGGQDEFLTEIYNHQNNDNSLVLLDKEDILSIEIFKD